MGQEAGKPAWPKPAGGYQTITGRRYGRRHAYVSFRPSLMNQDRNSSQQNGECEGLELDDVQKEKSLCPNPLVQVCSALSDEPSLQNGGSEVPVCRTVLRQTVETNTSPFSPVCYNQEGNQTSRSSMNPDKIPEDCAEYISGECSDRNGQNGIAFVNIDSYEPDSSDGEDDGVQVDFSLAKEEAGLFQETLDHMLSELEKEVESFSGIQSRLSTFNHNASREVFEEQGPVPSMRYYSIDSDLGHRNNRTFKKSPAEDEAIGKNNLSGSASCETQQRKIIADVAVRTPVGICNELNTSDGKIDQGNSPELVVRPKVRKQNATNPLDRKKLTSDDEEKSSTRRRSEIFEAQQGSAEHALRNSKEKMNSSMFFDPRDYEGTQKKTENDLKSNVTSQERTSVVDDSAFWDEFEDCSRHLPGSNKDEDREQTSLEEGEIPWLQYHEEIESSSDEENDPVSHFVHPGFFMLDGNNNLEDDSSMSEDLDMEWRLLDEFGDGLGVAQAISYVDPQFLTYMALEERLAQAMETALAHLESLAVDVEQAHPPASKESIDCLPQIIITENHNAVGQEQCCAICCSEYVKDEIITELPCHHFFHKPCVTLWLQKSGTCPVCRHVLAPVLPEAAAAATSFLSDHDSPPSVHSAAGTQ
ncbi:E3 ubiquitin-protein ligase Praja-2 isoform X2 [Terrapene carolina triunguis]|uniref:E3 ubiquitin-protein ligase Praja-2 isoform X2 n=1 Tax=Terrapene triunguis TaxID=2587831 RepID=UPI000CEFDC8D|nr:E3 ubiquitin-protein ligase Praja-2 isoform X2 [Terrapene carolina triunguis]